jgi:DNA invertase Pin-like site-specific DNA recombinase
VPISRDIDREGLGVDRQEQACRELAARQGWWVVQVYIDNDRSAYQRTPRREYLQMRADLAGGTASRVLVWHTDRLHRRNAELESWIGEIAEPYGVIVYSVQAGPTDLATPSGQMVARQLGAVAQYESAIKAERLRAKMEQKADNGEWLGGPVPFGWRSPSSGSPPAPATGPQPGRQRRQTVPWSAARATLASQELQATSPPLLTIDLDVRPSVRATGQVIGRSCARGARV